LKLIVERVLNHTIDKKLKESKENPSDDDEEGNSEKGSDNEDEDGKKKKTKKGKGNLKKDGSSFITSLALMTPIKPMLAQ